MTPDRGAAQRGSLIVAGTGIRCAGQLTTEALAWMRRADKLLYLVRDPVAQEAIRQLNAGSESLDDLYADGKPRRATYEQMVERILDRVRAGFVTVLAVYGHPAIFVRCTHESVRRARAEGFEATMLPAVSAEDCLFADLGVDPASHGCQSYDATDFFIHGRRVDTTSAVVLWQIGVFGEWTYRPQGNVAAIPLLVERLLTDYPPDHVVYVYEAAVLPGCEPFVSPVPLAALGQAWIPPMSTLYIPPARPTVLDPYAYGRLTSAGSRTQGAPSGRAETASG